MYSEFEKSCLEIISNPKTPKRKELLPLLDKIAQDYVEHIVFEGTNPCDESSKAEITMTKDEFISGLTSYIDNNLHNKDVIRIAKYVLLTATTMLEVYTHNFLPLTVIFK